jgi:c(7)-type cytochrome triheme protein
MNARMARSAAAVLLALLSAGVATPARAVPPGVTIEFDGKGEGKVTFAGARHTGPAMRCSVCHLQIFDLSRSSQITRADHKRKDFCFVCHDGKRAFAARGQCERCHAEPGVTPEVPLAASVGQ